MFRNLLFLLCTVVGPVAAQTPSEIPEQLRRNSDAVIRLASIEFVYNSPHSAVGKIRTKTTILKTAAARKGFFVCPVDPTLSLKGFSGTVSDAQGRVIRKLKRSELKYTEYSTSLADDTGYYLLEIHVPTTPYTVDVEYELALKDGILSFPPFLPVASSETSLEKGIYTLSLPPGTAFGYKSSHMGEPEKSVAGGRDIYRWTIDGMPAIRSEAAAPDPYDLVPYVFAAPAEFRFEGTQGSMRDWVSFGVWLRELLEGRDELPEALAAEVRRRTEPLPTPREKVRALYDYLGESTRYVSIQLGIGGMQPMSAAEVYRTKFGDCKALSNYLRAMLAACGIESDYVIIHTDRKRMHRDFASANQANHAILRVPLESDTLWVECTNPEIPLGYLHSGIAGHDALLVTERGGRLVTLPACADTLNRLVRHLDLTIAPDGSATGHVTERYEGMQYEPLIPFPKAESRRQTDRLLGKLKLPLVRVSGITVTERKEALPHMEIAYDIESQQYVNRSGNRAFAPLFPFDEYDGIRDKERTQDICCAYGYQDLVTVTIRLPENMRLETVPRPGGLTTPMGSYSLEVTLDGQTLTAAFRTVMHAGTYPRDEYEAFKKLLNGRSGAFNGSIVLKTE